MKNRQSIDPLDYEWCERLEEARQAARARGLKVSFVSLEARAADELPAPFQASRTTLARYHAKALDCIEGKVVGVPSDSADLMLVQWLCSLYGVDLRLISQEMSDDLDAYWYLISSRDTSHVGSDQAFEHWRSSADLTWVAGLDAEPIPGPFGSASAHPTRALQHYLGRKAALGPHTAIESLS